MDLLGVELRTDRLRLRPVVSEDCDEIYREFTDEVTRYMGIATPRDPSETRQFIANARRNMDSGEELVCAILDAPSGRLLGCGGIHALPSRQPELGIWLARSAQGEGRGLEAVAGFRAWGTTNCPRATHFRYPVDRANIASRRIAEILGGTEATEYERKALDGRNLDIVEYHVPLARN